MEAQKTSLSIRTEVRQILNEHQKQKKEKDEIQKNHSEFVVAYPKLFEKLLEDNVDKVQLEYILKMYEKVQTRKVGFEDASKEIGKKMFDQYVAPSLPEVPEGAEPKTNGSNISLNMNK